MLNQGPPFVGSNTNQDPNALSPDSEKCLTYQVAFCSMALALLWERFYNYPTLLGTGTESNKNAPESDVNTKAQPCTYDTYQKLKD